MARSGCTSRRLAVGAICAIALAGLLPASADAAKLYLGLEQVSL